MLRAKSRDYSAEKEASEAEVVGEKKKSQQTQVKVRNHDFQFYLFSVNMI